ncbi:MAG: DUF4332 domain-containing protein [Candidatus Helarchaeota archaeon]
MSKRKSSKKTSKPAVKSKTPEAAQIMDVSEIEGIGKKYARALYRAGIKSTEDLRKNSLVEIVEATNLSPKRVYRWQCIADLFRVRRAAQEWTELLYEIGIETVKELSKQNAKDLHAKIERMHKVLKRKPGWRGDVKKIPSLSDVQKMIDSAKELIAAGKDETEKDVKDRIKVTSKTPAKGQISDIINIEGIGKEIAKTLNEVGIENTEQLRKAPLVELVEVTGLSPKRLYKWICMADLFRVEGVDEEYSDLLFFAGIDTVKELSRQRIADLTRRIRRAALKAKEKGGWAGDVKKIPGETTIRKWIKSAKELVKKT